MGSDVVGLDVGSDVVGLDVVGGRLGDSLFLPMPWATLHVEKTSQEGDKEGDVRREEKN